MAERTIASFDDRDYEDSDECMWAWEDFLDVVEQEVGRTRIKKGFLEVLNGGWRSQHGMTEVFDAENARNLMNKISVNGEWSVEMWKDGHQLGFTRYSHDEPTGATILLKSQNKFKGVHEEIFSD